MVDVLLGTGRRKTSVARVMLSEGSGEYTFNGKNIDRKKFLYEIYLGVTHVIAPSSSMSSCKCDPSVSVVPSPSICSRIDLSVVALTPKSTPEYMVLTVDF